MKSIIKKALIGAALVSVVAGCGPTTTPTPPPTPLVTVVVYAYTTDSDASPANFVDIPVTVILEATTVAGNRPVNMFNQADGTVSNTLDVDVEHTPWKYEFYKATEPVQVSVSAATVLVFGQNLTLACHALAGPDGSDAPFVALDEAPGPGPVGVTCDFVVA